MDDLENINFSLIEKLLHYIKSYQLKVRFVHLGVFLFMVQAKLFRKK